MDIRQAIVKRLAELMAERGWTQYQLFKMSGVPITTINTIFNKKQGVRLDTLFQLLLGLGVEFTEFFDVDYLKFNSLNNK